MIRINLLPVREERRKQDLRQLAAMLVATLVGSLAIAGFFHASLLSDLEGARANVARLNQEIDRFKPQLAKVEQYKATKTQIEKKLEVIEGLEQSRSGPVRVLDVLATHAPEKLWLSEIHVSGRSIRIEGMSLDNERVATFMTALEQSDYFQGIELASSEAEEVDGFKVNAFELSAVLASPGEEERRSREQQTAARSVEGEPVRTGRREG